MYGYKRTNLPCPNEEAYCHYTSPELLLKSFGMEKENYWVDVGYLIATTIFVRMLAYFALKRKMRQL